VAAYQPGETSASFIDRADQALYEAKRLGKNQVIILEDEAKQIEEEKQKLLHFVSHFGPVTFGQKGLVYYWGIEFYTGPEWLPLRPREGKLTWA